MSEIRLVLFCLALFGAGPAAAQSAFASLEPAYRLLAASDADEGDLQGAETMLQALSASAADTETRLIALDVLAALAEKRGHDEAARQLTVEALALSQVLDIPDYAYRLYWRQGRLLERANLPGSLDAWRAAAQELKRVPEDASPGPGYERAASDDFRRLYPALVERLLEHAGDAPEQTLMGEAVAVWEDYKFAELRDHLGAACMAPRGKTDPRRLAEAGVALVYMLLLPQRLELVVAVDGRLQRYVNRRDRSRVESLARRFAAALSSRARGFRRYGEPLHRILIEPALDAIRKAGAHTLVLVPDGALRSIPFAALQGRDGRYLVDELALAVVPGLNLVSVAAAEQPRRGLLAGNAPVTPSRAAGFEALPGAGRELQWLGSRLQGAALQGEAFTAPGLDSLLRHEQFDLIHLASHVEVAAQKAGSFLVTADGKMPLEQLEELIANRRFADRPLDLLTLSACRTAVGNERSALGLAGLAVQTGARSALASLWPVHDQATARLMTEFYRWYLDPSRPGKAEALRRAQREFAGQESTHPFYWAGFQMFGYWQ